jgi:hypothetical protein
MAKWRKKESLGNALAREGRGTAKGFFEELLSIGTLGFYKTEKVYRRDGPNSIRFLQECFWD